MGQHYLVNCKIQILPHFMFKAEITNKTELCMKVLIKSSY